MKQRNTHGGRRMLATLLLVAAGTAWAVDLRVQRVATLGEVLDIRNAGDGSGRLFLATRPGVVRILRDGALVDEPYLDINGRVASGGERGLLSIAFAPDHARSGFFYAWYTDNDGDTVLSRFRDSGIPDRADPASERIILRVAQPFANHNGGRLQFGPDGYLYLGIGDGGGGGDPMGNAQDPATLLGKLIRIDVNPVHGDYAIPPDNPFAGGGEADPETWALGLRNPWRISFDTLSGELYIADVGQNTIEEVNVQPAGSPGGENYGWNIAEGSGCFVAGCDLDGLTAPVAEYTHAEGCSVTGGEVYRGTAYPALYGRYLYGDFCSGMIWSLRRVGGDWQVEALLDSPLSISTFGLGEDGSLYVASLGSGVYLLSDGPPRPEAPFRFNAGLNDAWVSPGIPGQGLLLNVFPQGGIVFGGWFTYEIERPPSDVAVIGEAGHRWLTVQGPWQDRRAELTIYRTRGGVFDAPQPAPGGAEAVGTMRIDFSDCDHAQVSYSLTGVREGAFAITRVGKDNVGLCEALSAP